MIDAWLDNQRTIQSIYVSRSQPYFNSSFPQKIDGADVRVFDENGLEFVFVENDSAYTWVSADGQPFGEIGLFYQLIVDVEGQQFEAFADLGRVPEIDSIKFRFEEKGDFFPEDYYLAEFVARDPEGTGDTYWIKAWKNGQYLNKPGEINIAWDAAFSRGGGVDGAVFIQPIQDGINPFDEDPENDNEFLPPYLIGDSVYVEIHSINEQAFFFLQEIIVQTDRPGGFAALFAQPLANVSTNIVNSDPNSEEIAFGFFNVAAISSDGLRLSEDLAATAREEASN